MRTYEIRDSTTPSVLQSEVSEADAAENTAAVHRVFFYRTGSCTGHVPVRMHAHVRTKSMPYRRFWISNRNGTDTINEPSSVINRFPLETVIHRRLALSQLISCRYRRSNGLTCIHGSEYVMRIYLMEINVFNSLLPISSLRILNDMLFRFVSDVEVSFFKTQLFRNNFPASQGWLKKKKKRNMRQIIEKKKNRCG